MADGASRLTAHLLQPPDEDLPELPKATVTAVTPGGASDGNALVTVDYLGSTLQFGYLSSYTPAVGHVVALGRIGGNWTILGRPIGHP